MRDFDDISVNGMAMQRTQLDGPFAIFLEEMDAAVAQSSDEDTLLNRAELSLKKLLDHGAWLPQAQRQSSVNRYQQHALYIDPQSRYSAVSFVWRPGQTTPVHNHTVWGLVGVLEGVESCEEFERGEDEKLRAGHVHELHPGEIDRVSPRIGDVHRAQNASTDGVTISIHVYGGDIGQIQRSIFESDGTVRPFVSGYSSAPWVTA